MKPHARTIIFLILVALVGGVGAWVGDTLFPCKQMYHHQNGHEQGLYFLFRDELDITDTQKDVLDKIDADFKQKKNKYEQQMKQANIDLAVEIEKNGYQSPHIEEIVHSLHDAMGKAQFLCLEHLNNMQNVLTEKQRQKMKKLVIEKLHQNAGK